MRLGDFQEITLAHELAHLYLGHLGPDKYLSVPQRPRLRHDQKELEAESVAYIVCCRNDVQSASEAYLARFVQHHATVTDLDLYVMLKAAGLIETVLNLAAHTRFKPVAAAR